MIAAACWALDPDSVRDALIFLVTGLVNSPWYSQVNGAPAHSMPRNAVSTCPTWPRMCRYRPGSMPEESAPTNIVRPPILTQ